MKLIRVSLLAIACTAILTSCQKEVGFQDDINSGTVGGQSIVGEYKLVGLQAIYNNYLEDDMGGGDIMRIAAEGNMIGINPTGTVKFTNTRYTTTNMAYDINATIYLRTYINGVLIDEQAQPWAMPAGPFNDDVGYVRNRADSITFDSPTNLPDIPSSGGTNNPYTGKMGANISWSGDTLIIKSDINFITVTSGPVQVDTKTITRLKKI